jgi:hypothetical protein
MNPQQLHQSPKPGSEYDFFMNPQKPPKQSPLTRYSSGNSLAVRLVVIVAIAFGVMILLSIVISALGGGNNKSNLIVVAQDQNELIRVAGLANTSGANQSSQQTQNFAQSASLSISSDQTVLLNFMAAHVGKPNPHQLTATKDLTTDSALNNSIASSSFDSTFTSVMQKQLTNYQSALKTAYASSHSITEKQLLNNDYLNAALLLQQINNPDQ